jgi:hypothetical protein
LKHLIQLVAIIYQLMKFFNYFPALACHHETSDPDARFAVATRWLIAKDLNFRKEMVPIRSMRGCFLHQKAKASGQQSFYPISGCPGRGEIILLRNNSIT